MYITGDGAGVIHVHMYNVLQIRRTSLWSSSPFPFTELGSLNHVGTALQEKDGWSRSWKFCFKPVHLDV